MNKEREMKALVAGAGAVIVAVVLLALMIAMIGMSAGNAEVSARNAFNAQQKVNESSFDKVWKTIQQQAGVAEAERESFRKTYSEIMAATKGVAGTGGLASFFTQAKIDVSPELYSKLMTSIEAQRESFHRDQQHLLRLKQQHDDIRMRMPYSFFVGSRPELEVKIVTSSKTLEAFSSGVEDDIAILNKN
jgi:hypothetical protein